MDSGQQPATTTDWHFFKDLQPQTDACFFVYWEQHDSEFPECFFAHDYSFHNGKLYDANFEVVDLDVFSENVIWSHWPTIKKQNRT